MADAGSELSWPGFRVCCSLLILRLLLELMETTFNCLSNSKYSINDRVCVFACVCSDGSGNWVPKVAD